MNYVDLILIIVLLAAVLGGYCRGFFVSLLSLARFAIGVPLSFFAADKLSETVYNSFIRENLISTVAAQLEESGVDAAVSSFKEAVDSLPQLLQGAADLSFLDNANASAFTQGVMENIIDPVAVVVCEMAIFVLTLFIFYVITGIVISLVKKIRSRENVPFKNTDRFIGALFGLVKGIIAVGALCVIGNYMIEFTQGAGNEFVEQLSSSAIMGFAAKLF